MQKLGVSLEELDHLQDQDKVIDPPKKKRKRDNTLDTENQTPPQHLTLAVWNTTLVMSCLKTTRRDPLKGTTTLLDVETT